jgi:arylsulfatase A
LVPLQSDVANDLTVRDASLGNVLCYCGAGDYGDFVETVDASVGDVLSALDRDGLTESTFLVFASDNGARWTPEEISQFDHRSNLNNRGQKSDIYDGGHRIPFLARWPGKIRAGSTSAELGCLVDLMATCAGVAAVPLPQNSAEDSFDLRPALLEKHGAPIRDAVVHHSGSGMFAIRSREWKLVEGLGSGGFTPPVHVPPLPGQPDVQLYDLQTDREEQTNAAAAHPEIVRALRAKLQQIQSNGRSRPDSLSD